MLPLLTPLPKADVTDLAEHSCFEQRLHFRILLNPTVQAAIILELASGLKLICQPQSREKEREKKEEKGK